MCTLTENLEVSEIIEEPRNINVLLALETYQGMSDAEIDMLLEYKIGQALASAELRVKVAAETERMEQSLADNRAGCQRALDMVESLLNRGLPEFPTPVAPIVTPTVLEV